MVEEISPLFQKFLRTYQKNEAIFEEGDEGHEMFLVHQGEVEIQHKTKTGRVVTLANLKPGDFFGEMALVDDYPRSASAVARENDTQLIVLDKRKFTYMVQQLPDFSLAIMQKLCQRLRETNIQKARHKRG